MNVQLKLDPDTVAESGRTLAGIARRMADDVAVLEATVHGPGNPWGEDESSGLFAIAYQQVLGHALQALGSYVQEMGEAAVALTETARAVAATDDAAASAIGGPS